MCNFFLADEINRTSSKTQSALLEVMQEGKVTVDGQTHVVPKPFVVMATQNPIGTIGTQMLPEAQLDRFMIQLSMGYPGFDEQVEILLNRDPVSYTHLDVYKRQMRYIPLLKTRYDEISMGQKCMGWGETKGLVKKTRLIVKKVSDVYKRQGYALNKCAWN